MLNKDTRLNVHYAIYDIRPDFHGKHNAIWGIGPNVFGTGSNEQQVFCAWNPLKTLVERIINNLPEIIFLCLK